MAKTFKISATMINVPYGDVKTVERHVPIEQEVIDGDLFSADDNILRLRVLDVINGWNATAKLTYDASGIFWHYHLLHIV